MIVKVCQFKARSERGERLVQVFQPGEMEKAAEFFGAGPYRTAKYASPMLPEVQNYLEKLKPDSNRIYVLVNALGAGEYWGSNINGDYFPEASLIHKGPVYGYETFYGAFPYKHHVNKDPSRSFGKVELAAWNDRMKRVELVVMIDRELAARFGAQDVCDKLDHGLFPDVSMGCKVPYDLCSKCLDWKKYREAQSTFDPSRHRSVGAAVLEFHKKNPIRGLSVTRNDYCEHLKTMLNRILEDGTKIYAINDYPRFFDISFVFIGADKTAKVMAKLASPHTGGAIYVVEPSWQVAENLGYQQPSTEKELELEKAAALDWITRGARRAADPDKVRRAARAVVRGGRRAAPVAKEVGGEAAERILEHALERSGKEKLSGIDAVRAMLREKRASHNKGAEIIKEVVPTQFGSKAVPLEGSQRPDLPDEVLDEMGKCPLHEALSTPTTMGMILKPREFQRITIIHVGKKPLADKLDEEGKIFAPVQDSDESVPMGGEHFSDSLKRLLLPLLEDRSCLEPIARRRLVRVTIRKEPEHEEPDREMVEDDPFLQKISAAYNGYLDRFVDCWRDAPAIVDQHADLWETVFRQGVGEGFSKEAAGTKVNPVVVLGGIAAGYGLSEYARWQREKARMGGREPVGPIMDTLAEHPKILATLGGLAALEQQGSKLPRRLYHGIKGAITMGK
jgi:hypothetical protein